MSFAPAVYLQSPPWARTVLLNAHGWWNARHRCGAPYRAAVQCLLEQESWTAERIRDYQDARIRAIVHVAFGEVTCNRRFLDEARILPADIKGVAYLPILPHLTKNTVRARDHELMMRRQPGRGLLLGRVALPPTRRWPRLWRTNRLVRQTWFSFHELLGAFE